MKLIRAYQVAAFYLLAGVLSWWPWLASSDGPDAEPILPLGPLLATIAVLLAIGGWAALKPFLAAIVRWRVGWRWYLLVLGMPAAIALAATALNLAFGAVVKPGYQWPALADLAGKFAFIFVLIGLGEEPAWRGFALPRLMARRSALVASLLLWPLHLLWHWPLFGIEYHLWNAAPWALALLAYTVIATWMFNRAAGSLLLPALFHAMVNTSAFVFGMFEAADLVRLWWLFALMWLLAGAVIVARAGPGLGRPAEQG